MSEQKWQPVEGVIEFYDVNEQIRIGIAPGGTRIDFMFKGKTGSITMVDDGARGLRVCEAVADQQWGAAHPNALAVPVDDIERILREHDMTYGFRRESNLMVRRVQRWLDALPREKE